jgi:hypothetical protein
MSAWRAVTVNVNGVWQYSELCLKEPKAIKVRIAAHRESPLLTLNPYMAPTFKTKTRGSESEI